MTRHPVNDSLEISFLGALWAGKGAKCWAAFSGHGVKILVGTDKSRSVSGRYYLASWWIS